MSLVIDIIIILAAVASVYGGIVRGFVKSASGFISLILALTATYMFASPAAEWLDRNAVSERVGAIVSDSITSIVTAGEQKLALADIFADRPEALDSIASRFGFDPDEVGEYYSDKLAEKTDSEAIEKLSDYIAAPTSAAISRVLAAAGVFLIALIALKFAFFILDLICRLPVLDQLNTLLGLIFGILSAIVFAWAISNIAVGVIRAFSTIRGDIFNQTVIDGSVILKFFYQKGFILAK